MSRKRVIIVVVIAAVGLYLLYRYIKHRGGQGSGTGALGTNLNSVAPELIGAQGPSQGPAASIPVTINVTETTTSPADRDRELDGPVQTAGGIGQLNATPGGAGVNRGEQPGTTMGTPMRSTAGSRSPMHAQSRAAGKTAGSLSPESATARTNTAMRTGPARSPSRSSAVDGKGPAPARPVNKKTASRRKAKAK